MSLNYSIIMFPYIRTIFALSDPTYFSIDSYRLTDVLVILVINL